MECLTAIGLFVAVMALAFAAVAHRRVRAAERALGELRAEVARLRELSRPVPAAVSEPAAPPAPVPTETPAAPPAAPALPPVPAPLPAATISPQAAPAPPRSVPPSPPAPPRPRVSLEERLGARLPVWIGSIALALAGAFLVKYSFDQGLLSPAVRVAIGVAFGLVLLGAGEWLRRSSSRVAQGLAAAGVADLFACFLAGVHLYHLISPAAGFGLIALTTAVAVGLSLRQGPMVALIGLIGGFLAPYLIRSGPPSARNLFGYLLLLELGILTAARRRGWGALAALSLASGLLWVVAWLAGPFQASDGLWLCLFLVLLVAAAMGAALPGRREDWGSPATALHLVRGTAALGLVAIALVAGRAGYSTTEWLFFGLLAAGVLVLGILDAELAGLAWVAAGTGAALLSAWAWAWGDGEVAEPARTLHTALGLGLLFAGGSLLAAWLPQLPRLQRQRAPRAAPRRGRWAALSAASAVAYFLLAYGATRDKPTGVSWGALALVLALLYVAAAYAVARRRAGPSVGSPAGADWDAPLAAVAVAATTFVSLAVPLELERAWLAVAWAAEVPALVWLAGRFRLPALTTLARLLAVLVFLRLFYPGVLEYPIGGSPLLNWLLYGYGVPLLALAGAGELARRNGDSSTGAALELEALAFAWALLTLEIRQSFHPGAPGALAAYLAELATLAVAWILLGWGTYALGRRLGRANLRAGGLAVAWLGLGGAVVGPGLAANPLWEHRAVGETPIANLLLWAFGAPVAALAGAARTFGRARPDAAAFSPARISARVFSIAALVFLFVLVTLEVRQAFRGNYLDGGASGSAEQYAYSAAWILFATALLVVGIARRGARGRLLRYASLAVMMVAVFKVFLYDTKNLGDLYRVFSFLGLGASLLLLAFLYQRFVFREQR